MHFRVTVSSDGANERRKSAIRNKHNSPSDPEATPKQSRYLHRRERISSNRNRPTQEKHDNKPSLPRGSSPRLKHTQAFVNQAFRPPSLGGPPPDTHSFSGSQWFPSSARSCPAFAQLLPSKAKTQRACPRQLATQESGRSPKSKSVPCLGAFLRLIVVPAMYRPIAPNVLIERPSVTCLFFGRLHPQSHRGRAKAHGQPSPCFFSLPHYRLIKMQQEITVSNSAASHGPLTGSKQGFQRQPVLSVSLPVWDPKRHAQIPSDKTFSDPLSTRRQRT